MKIYLEILSLHEFLKPVGMEFIIISPAQSVLFRLVQTRGNDQNVSTDPSTLSMTYAENSSTQ